MTKRERTQDAIAYHEIVGQLPCVLCRRLGLEQVSRTSVHHQCEGTGIAQRSGHFLVAALCKEQCHQGPHGIHGDKARLYNAKVTEADLIDQTIAEAFASIREVLGHGPGNP